MVLWFVRCEADTCVFRLMEDGKVTITVVVHVDYLFAAGDKERCNKFGKDLNDMVPVKNLGELRLYAGCVYDRNKEAGLLTISQKTYAETLVAEYHKRKKYPAFCRRKTPRDRRGGGYIPDEGPFREC